MKINHVGYAVENIEKSARAFECLGFVRKGSCIQSFSRNLCFQFMEKGGDRVELVQVIDSRKDSFIKKYLNRGPYHICCEIENMEETVAKLKKQGFLKINETPREESVENRAVVFMYSKYAGLIELWEY